MHNVNYKRGMTLIEIVVVLGILMLILSLGLSSSLGSFKINTLRSEGSSIISALEKARSKSMNNMLQSPYGFCYISPNYIIFQDGPGTRCISGVTSNVLISANTNISNNPGTTFPTIIIFSQLAGTTTPTNIHLTDGVKSLDININYEGAIIW